MIVCIPSKARPKTTTHKLFEEVGFKVYHFIEPQELNLYKVPNAISIEKNNKGIAYVRNFILNWAKSNNHEWIIVCDDDVDHFGEYKNGNIKKDAKIWNELYLKCKNLPFEIVGINYRQLAWTEKANYSINKKFAEVCVLMNVKKINWSYRSEFNLKEDGDFALQTIQKGNGILRFNKFFYNCPDVGTNKGGLHNEYQAKRDEESALKMCREWHPFVRLKKKGERVDMKTDIKALATHYKRQVK